MAIQLGTNYRNALLDSFETTVSASPRLKIYGGTQPANCAAASGSVLIVNMLLPGDWMGAAAAGVKALSGTWSASASGSGTAGHFRIMTTGSTTEMQGSITATAGGGDMTLDNIAINENQTVTITSFSLTAPGV
jgi:hypothetical protein